ALARLCLGAARMRWRGRLAIALLVVVVAAGALVGVAIRQGSPASLVARKGHLAAVGVAPGGGGAISTGAQAALPRAPGRGVAARGMAGGGWWGAGTGGGVLRGWAAWMPSRATP